MFSDPEPHVEIELQRGLLGTLVRPPSFPVDQEVVDLIACATLEPSKVRAHILSRAEALAGDAGC